MVERQVEISDCAGRGGGRDTDRRAVVHLRGESRPIWLRQKLDGKAIETCRFGARDLHAGVGLALRGDRVEPNRDTGWVGWLYMLPSGFVNFD